ncbi:MAG: peptide deformylase [Flavobacteriales bacterium]|nr:peptide deformylase [Flavobacteriales bacterium]
MILPIYAYGHPILRKDTHEIEELNDEMKKLISNMFETMYGSNGVGLAAPQIGKALRLFIIDGSPFAEDEAETEEEKKENEFLKTFKRVFINPIIEEEHGEEWGFEEGCLSIPGIREEVFRQENVVISYYNEDWELVEEKLSGLAARVVQHEYDHIEAKLFTDYLSPMKRRLNKRKLTDISKGIVPVKYKMKFPK